MNIIEKYFEENSELAEKYPEGFTKGTYDSVKRRIFQGGKFAVTSVKREGKEDIGGVDLYISIQDAQDSCIDKKTYKCYC